MTSKHDPESIDDGHSTVIRTEYEFAQESKTQNQTKHKFITQHSAFRQEFESND